jgi:hypothetical protein
LPAIRRKPSLAPDANGRCGRRRKQVGLQTELAHQTLVVARIVDEENGRSKPAHDHEKERSKNEQPAAASATLFGWCGYCGPLLLRHGLFPIEECLL